MSPSFHVGDLIDGFRIESLVAVGGFASVFRATDTRTGRFVAVKVPLAESRWLRWLGGGIRHEATIASKLHHSGIACLRPNERDCSYIVMDWAEGRSLRDILNQQEKFPAERAIRIGRRICTVLRYIHEQGVAHLDLKPENVIVDANEEVKLIDFGSARELVAKKSFFRTKPSGTPDYIAPEMLRGKSGDERSDIYSLGLILYEMLTGELPFSGVDVAAAIELRKNIDPASPQEIDPKIPDFLSDIVSQTIARNPTDRPFSAAAFGEALETAVLDLEPQLTSV
jgi:eukaryotic-like serine/threonine-protein kinase